MESTPYKYESITIIKYQVRLATWLQCVLKLASITRLTLCLSFCRINARIAFYKKKAEIYQAYQCAKADLHNAEYCSWAAEPGASCDSVTSCNGDFFSNLTRFECDLKPVFPQRYDYGKVTRGDPFYFIYLFSHYLNDYLCFVTVAWQPEIKTQRSKQFCNHAQNARSCFISGTQCFENIGW